METKINFEEISKLESGDATLYHYGVAEVNGEEFEFTLIEMVTNDYSSFDITWVDETPENQEVIESQIMDTYSQENNK